MTTRSRESTKGHRPHPKPFLTVVALSMTVTGVLFAGSLTLLVALRVVAVPWNAVVLPRIAFAGLLPFCILGLVASSVSLCRHRDIRSLIAVVLGILAVATAIGCAFAIIVTGIAQHPV